MLGALVRTPEQLSGAELQLRSPSIDVSCYQHGVTKARPRL
jgi:hypothetical protein